MKTCATPSIPRRVCLAALAALVLAPAAHAGELSLTLDGGWYQLTASDSAKAVLDASGGPTFGLAAQYGLGERFFIRAGARYFHGEGERVFVATPASPVFGLGHPLTVRIVPAYGLVGFRFLQGSSLRPYVGLGGGATSYKEESDVAGEIFTSTATKASGHAVAGLDFGRGAIRFGGEIMYATAPNAVGFDGVSEVYGEDDIGGLSAVVRISFVH